LGSFGLCQMSVHNKKKQENIRPEEIIGINQWPTIYSG